MTTYYTNEKAKFGGTTGTILPFTVKLDDINFPNQGDFRTLVPAGYLRCDGAIVRAELYPVLASVIGIGSSCVFAKNPDTLSDDFIQLPDLGSKYFRASPSSGEYFNDTVTTSDTGLKRVGAQTRVDTLIGNEVSISYTGSFDVAFQTGIRFIGNPFFEANANSGNTADQILTAENFQAHGHEADVGVFTYLGDWADSGWIDNGSSGGNDGANEGSNGFIQVEAPSGATNSSTHNHKINLPSSTELKNGTNYSFGYQNTPISPAGLVTNVTLTTENVQKLDKAVSPYIFVEYIIKI